MRGLLGWTAVAMVMGIVGMGCTSGVGSASGELYAVDGDLASRRDLYLDASLDSRPLTEAQFDALYGGLTEAAVPVEIEILDVAVVAWLRHEDGVVSRTRADVVALWRFEGVIGADEVNPVDGELSNVPGSPTYVPGNTTLEVGNLPNLTDTLLEGDDFIVVDFFDRLDTAIFTEPEIFQDFNEAHPGCA